MKIGSFCVVFFAVISCFSADYKPVVYAVEDEYQICIPVKKPQIMWVRIGEKTYYDESNGVLASRPGVRKIHVPASELDAAGKYTVGAREMQNRWPYNPPSSELEDQTFEFQPVGDAKEIHFLFISDVHERERAAINAGGYFGDKLNFLVLGGDLSNDSCTLEKLLTAHRLGWEITRGRIPVVYVRGNHEQKGAFAEQSAEYLPSAAGKHYYSVRLGSVWALVLDTGEDKPDEHRELGKTTNGKGFRAEVGRFLEKIAASEEYNAQGIRHRLILCHSPFVVKFNPPHSVGTELYPKWAELLREKIRPDAMFFGHMHRSNINLPGTEQDVYRQGSPAVIGCFPGADNAHYAGMAITKSDNSLIVETVDQNHYVLNRSVLADGKLNEGTWALPLSEAATGDCRLKFRLLDLGAGHGKSEFSGKDNSFTLKMENCDNTNYNLTCADFSCIVTGEHELVFQFKGVPENKAKLTIVMQGKEGGRWFGKNYEMPSSGDGEFHEYRLPLEKTFGFGRVCFEAVQCKIGLGGGEKGSTSIVELKEIRLVSPVAAKK